jgi:hypothetical protein
MVFLIKLDMKSLLEMQDVRALPTKTKTAARPPSSHMREMRSDSYVRSYTSDSVSPKILNTASGSGEVELAMILGLSYLCVSLTDRYL